MGPKCDAEDCHNEAAYYGLHRPCGHVTMLCWKHMGNAKRGILDRTATIYCLHCGQSYQAHETRLRRDSFPIYPLERIAA